MPAINMPFKSPSHSERAQAWSGQASQSMGMMKPGSTTETFAPGLTAGGGLMAGMGGAAMGATIGTTVGAAGTAGAAGAGGAAATGATTGATAGWWGAAIGAVVGLASYFLSE